ncbi:antitoxin Xre/MbcA/ParS toxin-binding domain-containing protein [Peristeroidobacter agariperforans]|uniref:antitoxin Xre/MbcA/ParS toxin-binding domain-containing protein n=1 Tax=Peristeroidobacter agariperforans TaxID=268404 RepID=UPI00101D55EF|nr:MbcA/ParS/Xre antitoxin family protein [Peristeroidobacter agariperforans]
MAADRADLKQLSPALLTKAVLRAVDQLNLAENLASLLHVSVDDAARLQAGESVLDPQREEWQGALQLVGLFRTIVEVLGSVERAKAWLGTPNETLGGRPVDLLATPDADRVHRYLNSVRKHELRMPPPVRREH